MITFSYSVHLITTVIWLGGLMTLAFIALPAWRKGALDDNQWLLLQMRLTPWVNVSMVLLWISGFIQMTNDPHYNGFLAIDNRWAWAMLLKHIAIVALMLVTFYVQFSLHPAIQRQMLQGDAADLTALHRRERYLLRLNVMIGLIVLLLTAVATAV